MGLLTFAMLGVCTYANQDTTPDMISTLAMPVAPCGNALLIRPTSNFLFVSPQVLSSDAQYSVSCAALVLETDQLPRRRPPLLPVVLSSPALIASAISSILVSESPTKATCM